MKGGNIFEYMFIAEIWAEFHSSKKAGSALVLYYSIINQANRLRWREWIHLNYDDLNRILCISEKTIKSHLEFLANEKTGIIEKDYDFRNHGKIKIRLKKKEELSWVSIVSNSEYDFLLDPTDQSCIEKPEEITKGGNTSKVKNRKKNKEGKKVKEDLGITSSDIEFVYDGSALTEFRYEDMVSFASKNYNSLNKEIKDQITEVQFNGYKNFYIKFGTKFFNRKNFEHNVTPFEYVELLHHLSDDEIMKGIDRINSSGGFYPNGFIAKRILAGIEWSKGSNQISNSINSEIEFNGSKYTMNKKSIQMMKPEDRIKIKRTMYTFIKGCSKIENLEAMRIAKSILDAYKINGENQIDDSTSDHSAKMISDLEKLKVTHDFIIKKGDSNIKEFLSEYIKKHSEPYFKYCYATFRNKHKNEFSFNSLIKKILDIKSINSDELFIKSVNDIMDYYIEELMNIGKFEARKLFQYNTNLIKEEVDFMDYWSEHTSKINKDVINFNF